MKKQSLKTRLFLNLFAFPGLCALQFATNCGPMPYLVLQDFIIIAVLTAAQTINTDHLSERQKHILLVFAAITPALIILRSYIEHKSFLDSALFFAIVLTSVFAAYLVSGRCLPAKKRKV
jgi:uncharacterized membrane protein YobD (UPF0266 family)